MNDNSNASTTIAARIASSTNAAGPSLRNASKSDPICESKARLGPVLRSLLKRCVTRHVLARRPLEAQTTAIDLCRKLTNLIHLSEILGPHGEEHISPKLPLAQACDRKSQARHAGGPPLRTRSRKTAPRPSESKRPGPLARKVDDGGSIHG